MDFAEDRRNHVNVQSLIVLGSAVLAELDPRVTWHVRHYGKEQLPFTERLLPPLCNAFDKVGRFAVVRTMSTIHERRLTDEVTEEGWDLQPQIEITRSGSSREDPKVQSRLSGQSAAARCFADRSINERYPAMQNLSHI